MASNPYDQFDGENPYDQFDATPEQPKRAVGAVDYAAAVPETLLNLISGGVAAPVSGLAGIGTAAARAVGFDTPDPADVVRGVGNALTYQPRTMGGQATADVVTYPFQKLGQFADWAGGGVSDLTGSPAVGAGLNTAIQAAPMALASALLRGKSYQPQPKALPPEVAPVVGAGLKLTPEQAGGTIGKAAQSLANSAKLERKISQENAPQVNNLVRQELGLPENFPLKRKDLNEAKKPYNAVYAEIKSLPDITPSQQLAQAIAAIPERTGMGISGSSEVAALKQAALERIQQGPIKVGDLLDEVRQLKRDAKKANSPLNYNPGAQAVGQAQSQLAKILDSELDSHIQQVSPNPNLFSEYLSARESLAKINSVQKATQGGNVLPGLLFKQLEKGEPLSGNLKLLANAFENFDRSFQNPARIRNSGPFDALDPAIGAGSVIGASLTNPALAIPGAAAIFGRPLVRSILASDAYQRAGIRGGSPSPIPANVGLLPFWSEQALLGTNPAMNQDRLPLGVPEAAY